MSKSRSIPEPQPSAQPQGLPAFHAAHSTPEQAREYLAALASLGHAPEHQALIDVARTVAEAQALAGLPFEPLIQEPLGLLSEQRRWYDIVAERAQAK